MSDFLDSPDLRIFAIYQLHVSTQGSQGLQPVDRMALASRYHIPEWIPLALPGVLAINISQITENHFHQMGTIFRDLTVLQHALTANREDFALHAPGLSAEICMAQNCTDHSKCCQVWQYLWWNAISQSIIRRTYIGKRTSMDSIIERIKELVDPSGSIFLGCLDLFTTNAINSYKIEKEELLIQGCREVMIQKCTGPAIETTLSETALSDTEM